MNVRVGTLERKTSWVHAARLLALITLALLIPALGLPQWITGPLVNALLLLTVTWAGLSEAILVGMLTPLGAAVRGVLPLPLLVMTPFIALANALFVSTYAALQRRALQRQGKHPGVALVAAAGAKFALLTLCVSLLVARPPHLLIGGNAQVVALPETIINMMRWPQLATALAGGLLALGVEGLRLRLRARLGHDTRE